MMGRREFITLIGAAAATWPLAAPAQQPAMATIGFISPGSLESDGFRLTAFRQGLNETGYVEGRNVAMEYRGMQGHYDLLSAFVGDFIRRPVAVIVIGGSALAALAAKTATSAIPIVFNIGVDPIDAGLVASLNRPGGNITGIFNLNGLLAAKRLELLHELMPSTSAVAFLVNHPAIPPMMIAAIHQPAPLQGPGSRPQADRVPLTRNRACRMRRGSFFRGPGDGNSVPDTDPPAASWQDCSGSGPYQDALHDWSIFGRPRRCCLKLVVREEPASG